MKIIVTGCSGFIGSNLVKYLNNKKEHNLYCINSDIDITNKYEIREILVDIKPECIIHLAAKSVPGQAQDKWDELWKVNVDGTKNLLHNAPEDCKFILASSISVHGSGFFNEKSHYNPTTIYASSKIAAESLVSSYHNLGRIKGIKLRFGAVVGPNLTHGVIKDFIKKLKTQEKLEILGDWPGSVKPYIHVDDVCDIISLIIENNIFDNNSYIVSANDSCTIDEISDIVMSELQIFKDKIWLGEKKNFVGDNRSVLADNRKVKTKFNWNPKHNHSIEAIKQCIRENL